VIGQLGIGLVDLQVVKAGLVDPNSTYVEK
jgi:hypothetical protein